MILWWKPIHVMIVKYGSIILFDGNPNKHCTNCHKMQIQFHFHVKASQHHNKKPITHKLGLCKLLSFFEIFNRGLGTKNIVMTFFS